MNYEKKLTDMSILGPFIESQIRDGKKVNLTVTGDSMYPLLKNRVDTVVLDKAKKPKKYDIAFYKRENGRYILHRILKEKNGVYTIAGDNEIKKEYPVKREQIIATVCEFTRKGKTHTQKEPFFRIYEILWVNFFKARPILLKIAMKIHIFFNGKKKEATKNEET